MEQRGAPDAEWRTVIDRISGAVPLPTFDDAFRDRVGGMIDDADFRARVLALLS